MTKGIKLAFITALTSGISIFINKYAVSAIKPALVFTTSKNVGVGILLLMILILSKKWIELKKLNKKDLINLGLIGIIGGSIPFYLFFEGLSQTSAINSALIHKTLVVWVAIFGYKFLKEKLNWKQWLAIGILFASNLVVGGFKGFEFSKGELMILGATILWGVENVIAKKTLKTVDSTVVSFARMGFGALVMIFMSLVKYPKEFTSISLNGMQWFWMTLTMATLMAYVLSWYKALKYEKAVTVTAILVSSTLVTNLLTAVFVTHTWSQEMLVQALMIVLGTYIFVREIQKSENRKLLKLNN